MNAEEYCQEQAAGSGSSFYYSFLFLPANQRQAITALYAFCREVDDIVDECTEITVAQTKLNWWKTEIHRVFHEQPQHPVGLALKKAIQEFDLDEKYFYCIIDGMLMDTHQFRYQDFNDLANYCYHVAGVVGLLAIEIFGYQHESTRLYAENLGLAFQLTNILRDVQEDAQRGRIYLPQDELTKFGVTEQQLINGENSNEIRELLAFQAQRAEQYYQKAYQTLPNNDRFNQRSGLIMAAIYHALLEHIKKNNYDIFGKRLKLSPLRKLWIAWRTFRHELKINKTSKFSE